VVGQQLQSGSVAVAPEERLRLLQGDAAPHDGAVLLADLAHAPLEGGHHPSGERRITLPRVKVASPKGLPHHQPCFGVQFVGGFQEYQGDGAPNHRLSFPGGDPHRLKVHLDAAQGEVQGNQPAVD